VIGFSGDRALAMPFGVLDGVRRGCAAHVRGEAGGVRPTNAWLGRVVDALGRPVDRAGPLPQGQTLYPFRADPPPAHARRRVGPPLDLGVRALNAFLTMCSGQRMGIFAGSGVGKSVLLSMLARFTAADVAVIGLVGERGREVQEFLQDDLGPQGLARSVVVVATSDEPALMRRNAAYLTLSLAEYFRDQGLQVLCMIDSITRFAMAQRDIGLAGASRPPPRATRPPSSTSCRACSSAPGPARGRAPSRGSSRCSSRATTTTSPWPTRCAASSTGTWSWSAGSPSAGATRPSTC
jgi:flagellum-specific ATP synthase